MRNLLFVFVICLFISPLYSQIGAVNCYEPHPPLANLPPFMYVSFRSPNEIAPQQFTQQVAPPPVIDSFKIVDSLCFATNKFSSGGVRNYDSTKACNGVTLLDQTTNSLLIDMQGKVLAKFPFGLTHILSNGNMIGATSGNLVKFDTDLDLLWQSFAAPHHEITTDENGNVYTLSRETHKFMGLNVNFDMMKVFSADGNLIYEWHVFDHLEEFVSIISKAPYLSHLHQPYDSAKGIVEYIAQDPEQFFWHFNPVDVDTSFEVTHFNSIQVLPENTVSKKLPAFKKGNILLSFNQYGCYGILDTATKKIEWAGYLPERTTLHTPVLTPAGTILVYQNSTDSNSLWVNRKKDPCLQYLYKRVPPKNPAPEPKARNWVSITEYDPVTNAKVWEYTANPKESLVASGLGSAQRLPNGNTLICIAVPDKGGQIFEVTPQKEIVWFYTSPEKDKENGSRPLTFYRATRVSYDIAKKIIPGFKK